MCYSPIAGRLFSISADGVFMMNDIKEQRLMHEFSMHKGKSSASFSHGYVPIYKADSSDFLIDNTAFALTSEACPTALAANQTGTMAVVAYSDDSLMLHDSRSNY